MVSRELIRELWFSFSLFYEGIERRIIENSLIVFRNKFRDKRIAFYILN